MRGFFFGLVEGVIEDWTEIFVDRDPPIFVTY